MVRGIFAAAAAGGLSVALGLRLADGSYTALVQGWYGPVLLVTAILLGLLAVAAAVAWVRGGSEREGRSGVGTLLGGGLVAIPVVMALVFTPEPLGSSSLNIDEGGTGAWTLAPGNTGADPSQRNVYQWAWEFQNTDPAAMVGQEVNVIGFVHRADGDVGDRFRVARFVVACCVADATGVWLPVQWAGADALEKDGWVQVEGRVAIGPDGAPVVQASAVTAIAAPSNPYIYP